MKIIFYIFIEFRNKTSHTMTFKPHLPLTFTYEPWRPNVFLNCFLFYIFILLFHLDFQILIVLIDKLVPYHQLVWIYLRCYLTNWQVVTSFSRLHRHLWIFARKFFDEKMTLFYSEYLFSLTLNQFSFS